MAMLGGFQFAVVHSGYTHFSFIQGYQWPTSHQQLIVLVCGGVGLAIAYYCARAVATPWVAGVAVGCILLGTSVWWGIAIVADRNRTIMMMLSAMIFWCVLNLKWKTHLWHTIVTGLIVFTIILIRHELAWMLILFFMTAPYQFYWIKFLACRRRIQAAIVGGGLVIIGGVIGGGGGIHAVGSMGVLWATAFLKWPIALFWWDANSQSGAFWEFPILAIATAGMMLAQWRLALGMLAVIGCFGAMIMMNPTRICEIAGSPGVFWEVMIAPITYGFALILQCIRDYGWSKSLTLSVGIGMVLLSIMNQAGHG